MIDLPSPKKAHVHPANITICGRLHSAQASLPECHETAITKSERPNKAQLRVHLLPLLGIAHKGLLPVLWASS
ncbi:hypothetical protein FS782_25105 [Agrobacterium vitis]|uniref:hypothetical protein n=1 Tax=Agrobacterium vitis TaxID=373 RepID=UPI0018D21B0A|nr:hypothetical protein [Agrobacterium vitis]MCF1480304.1 hypothetical protein [Agrobacterium vitis]